MNPPLNLFASFDRWGLSLKSRAISARAHAATAPTPLTKLLRTLQFCSLTTLFIAYRAYRGFFKILPAVFTQVRDKLAATIDYRPFEDDELAGTVDVTKSRVLGAQQPESAVTSAKPKATLTVTLLALVLTFSYAVRGLFGVTFSMLKAALRGKDIKVGFEAAADEVMRNEDRVMRMVGKGEGKEVRGIDTPPGNPHRF